MRRQQKGSACLVPPCPWLAQSRLLSPLQMPSSGTACVTSLAMSTCKPLGPLLTSASSLINGVKGAEFCLDFTARTARPFCDDALL